MWQDISLFRAQSFLFQLKISKTKKEPAPIDSLRTLLQQLISSQLFGNKKTEWKTWPFLQF